MESHASSSGSLKYRADIDGLRAIAVLAVLLFHYGAPGVTGGFVGVDIFFVISGYLITELLAERIAGTGLSLLDFYNRRVRRILPALFLVLLMSLVAGWWFLMPGDYADLGKSVAYAAAGLANLYFYQHTGYFDRAAEFQPLLHLWSLGVEEQFYLVWPAVLALIMWATGGRRRVIAGIGLVMTVLAFLYALRSTAGTPEAAFYLPQGRAWELGLGALLVFLPALPSRLAAEAAGLAGLGLIAYAVFGLTALDPFPGANALWPCLGSALLVWPRRSPSFLARALGTFPLRRTGEISYSLYLWHWPPLVFLRIYENGRQPSGATLAALGIAAYLLAYLSWLRVERPFRRWRVRPARAFGIGLAAIMLFAMAGSAVTLRAGFPQRLPAAMLGMQSLDAMWQWDCMRPVPFAGLSSRDCVFGQSWDQARRHALIWGDSHAEHMAPLIEAAADGLPDSFLLFLPCPAALGGSVQRDPAWDQDGANAQCRESRRRGIRLLQDHAEISLVILSASWRGVANTITPPGKPRGGPDAIRRVKAGIEEFLDATALPGRRFLIIGDVPQVPFDPASCDVASASGLLRQRCTGRMELTASFVEKYQGPVYDTLLAIGAEREDTDVVLPGRKLCASGVCLLSVDGEIIYRDGSHIRRNLGKLLKRHLADLFDLTEVLRKSR